MIPNGANIEVTEANKIDYISKMVEFRLTDGVKVRIKKVKFTMIIRGLIYCKILICDPKKHQIAGLAHGFNEVVNIKLLKTLEITDLELILNGTQEIDVQDWRSNTEYRGGYFDSHENISLFWDYIHNLSNG